MANDIIDLLISDPKRWKYIWAAEYRYSELQLTYRERGGNAFIPFDEVTTPFDWEEFVITHLFDGNNVPYPLEFPVQMGTPLLSTSLEIFSTFAQRLGEVTQAQHELLGATPGEETGRPFKGFYNAAVGMHASLLAEDGRAPNDQLPDVPTNADVSRGAIAKLSMIALVIHYMRLRESIEEFWNSVDEFGASPAVHAMAAATTESLENGNGYIDFTAVGYAAAHIPKALPIPLGIYDDEHWPERGAINSIAPEGLDAFDLVLAGQQIMNEDRGLA